MELNSEGGIPWYKDYRWWIVIIMLLGAVVNYFDRVNLSMANTMIRDEFGLSTVGQGFLLSAFMWPYMLASLPAGWLVDKFGINKIFIWSVTAWSLATIAGGFAIGFISLYLTRVLVGIAEAPFFIIGGTITQRYFAVKERGVASSIINMGPKIANGFAPPLMALMMITISWRGMFIVLGILGFVIVILWKLVYRKDDAKFVTAGYDCEPAAKARFNSWKLFNHPTAWWFNLGNLGSSYVFWLYFTWLPTYLMDERHLSLYAAGWVTAVPFIAGVMAVPIGGYISDWCIRRGVDVIRARLIPTVGGCLIAGIAVMPVNYVNDLGVAVLLLTISTFAVAARVGVLWALVGDITPKDAVGTFGGIQNFANFLGGTLAAVGTGMILAMTSQNYNVVFIVSGILCLLGSLSYAMIRHPIKMNEITD